MTPLLMLLAAAVQPAEIPLTAPKEWASERFALPPSFAPAMGFRGTEELRFAPGMYKPEADDFFSYAIAMRLQAEAPLDKKGLQRELLTYYRGLAKAVSRGAVATDDFTLTVNEVERDRDSDPLPRNAVDFRGELKWTEPFVTKKPQTLHLELRAWKDDGAQEAWLFVGVSPKPAMHAVWKQLHAIRDSLFDRPQ